MTKRKKLSTFSWIVFAFLLLCFVYLGYASFRIRQAQIDAENYQRAQICEEPTYCRQTLQATVLESFTVRSINVFRISRWMSKTEFKNFAYKIGIKHANSETYEVIILPNLNVNDFPFDLPNVSLPNVYNPIQDIAKLNFPQYSLLKVEVWNGKVTYVQLKNIETGIVTTKNTDIVDEYAVPTTDHPLVALSLLQDDLESFIGFAFLSVVFLAATKFVFKL